MITDMFIESAMENEFIEEGLGAAFEKIKTGYKKADAQVRSGINKVKDKLETRSLEKAAKPFAKHDQAIRAASANKANLLRFVQANNDKIKELKDKAMDIAKQANKDPKNKLVYKGQIDQIKSEISKLTKANNKHQVNITGIRDKITTLKSNADYIMSRDKLFKTSKEKLEKRAAEKRGKNIVAGIKQKLHGEKEDIEKVVGKGKEAAEKGKEASKKWGWKKKAAVGAAGVAGVGGAVAIGSAAGRRPRDDEE